MATTARLLPSELLEAIFFWATYNPVRIVDSLVSLKPFEAAHDADNFASCDAALSTKMAISLTCRPFRRLVKPFFYEDVRIRHGSEALALAFEREPRLGLHVKRMCIPPLKSDVPEAQYWLSIYPSGTGRILKYCTRLRILIRSSSPPTSDTENPTAPPPTQETIEDALSNEPEQLDFPSHHFPLLQRADWYNTPFERLPSASLTPPILLQSQFITTLTLGFDCFKASRELDEIVVDLPKLHTLRVNSLRSFGDRTRDTSAESVRLPALRRLVLERPSAIYLFFFEQPLRHLGPQIQTLEFGADVSFLRHDFIMVILMSCSNVTNLLFPVFTTMPTRKNSRIQVVEIVHPVEHLGLSAIGFLHNSDDENAKDEQWGRLGGHFLSLFGSTTRFSKVKTITFYGIEWLYVISYKMFKGMVRMLLDRGLRVICELPEVQEAWDDAVGTLSEVREDAHNMVSLMPAS